MKVILRPQAQISIKELFHYLCEIGYPDTATKFTERLRVFIHSLSKKLASPHFFLLVLQSRKKQSIINLYLLHASNNNPIFVLSTK